MSEETRSVSATGGEKGVKPERYDLLPKEGMDATARVYAFGATKYADHNWRRGYEWSKSIAAAMRHMMAFADGETHDPESGEPHPAHAVFHMFALLTWLAEQGEGPENPMDDRWPALMERARAEAEGGTFSSRAFTADTISSRAFTADTISPPRAFNYDVVHVQRQVNEALARTFGRREHP